MPISSKFFGRRYCRSAYRQLQYCRVLLDLIALAASHDRWAFTMKEPIGVVAAISAFNHPLNLVVHQVVPAIATGCPVIIKPATSTPLSCLRFAQETGFIDPRRMREAFLRTFGLPPQAFRRNAREIGSKRSANPRMSEKREIYVI